MLDIGCSPCAERARQAVPSCHLACGVREARQADPLIRVVVGGAAFRLGAWRDTGATDYATDVRSAIALLCGETTA